MDAVLRHPSESPFFQTRQIINAARDNALLYFWLVMPRSSLRLLPGTSMAFGPPRRAEAWDAFRARTNPGWRAVFPAKTEQLPQPFYCNDARVRFAERSRVEWQEFGVAELPRGRILDDHAWVVGADDTFLGDFCYSGLDWHSPVNRIVKLRPVRRIAGKTLNLCTAFALHNFFHYMIDGVSRWELVKRAGYTWDDFDHVVLPRFASKTTLEIDEAMGIPQEKIIRLGRREHLECEILVQPSFPGAAACTPWWVADFYRSLLPTHPQRRDRKIYLARRGNRQPTNIQAIDARLAELGFETLDPMQTPDFRDRLAEASHVVGIHGAGLANLVFCTPGTRVLEILPTDIAYFHNFAYYYTICAGAGLPYGAVIGPSLKTRMASFKAQVYSDFDVDFQAFEAGVDRLLSA